MALFKYILVQNRDHLCNFLKLYCNHQYFISRFIYICLFIVLLGLLWRFKGHDIENLTLFKKLDDMVYAGVGGRGV